MIFFRSSRIFVLALLVCFPLPLMGQEELFICRIDSAPPPAPMAPSTGVAKGVAIYATWSNTTHPKRDSLPSWWKDIWDSTRHPSVPKFYKDNSLGSYRLQITPYGLNSQLCFKTSVFPDTGDFSFPGTPPNGGWAFTDSILRQADDSINFADFDADGDNYVDAVFLIIVNMSGVSERGSTLSAEYLTNDFSPTGRIRIQGADGSIGFYGAGLFANSEGGAIFVSSHEWGHALGLYDFYGDGGAKWWELGSFSIMSGGIPYNQGAVPFDPNNRIQLGWATPTEITAPLYQQTIPDYLTTGTVYKLTIKATRPTEYFLVTNHRGVDPDADERGRWEGNFAGHGLVIWHVDSSGEAKRFYHKLIDIEAAHGLWNFDTLCHATTENPVSGKDSLDCARCIQPPNPSAPCIRYGYSTSRVQSGRCFWNPSTKINFDGLSNPSSDGYTDSTFLGPGWPPLSVRVQNIPTHLAARNVSATLFQSAMADLLVNNLYGHISTNTTWGPNKVYAITGDITVDSGYTLTIDSGTTVYFQYNEDNQRAGADTTKIDFRVAKGGKLIINGKPNFPVKFLSSRSEALASTEDWRGIVVKPGGYISVNNAIIRHAYAGIEDSSRYLHTIQNVKIGRCQMYGILASNTDSLTIRNCRIDSVYGVSGGTGILVHSSSSAAGARLVKDTVRGCWYGIHIEASATPGGKLPGGLPFGSDLQYRHQKPEPELGRHLRLSAGQRHERQRFLYGSTFR